MHRAVDQHGQVIAVFVSRCCYMAAARRLFGAVLTAHDEPAGVITDLDQLLETSIEPEIPNALQMPSSTLATATCVIRGHTVTRRIRRGHYKLGTNVE